MTYWDRLELLITICAIAHVIIASALVSIAGKAIERNKLLKQKINLKKD